MLKDKFFIGNLEKINMCKKEWFTSAGRQLFVKKGGYWKVYKNINGSKPKFWPNNWPKSEDLTEVRQFIEE